MASGDFSPLSPRSPLKKSGTGYGSEDSTPAAGGAGNVFSADESAGSHPIHPAAVVLCLAWCRAKGLDHEDRLAALGSLDTWPPGEQVRRWHGACIDEGLKPWLLLCLPAPKSGGDCTRCSHLTTRQYAETGGRRLFHWACGLGYLILETGRGTERIWTAPPECQSWERWQPRPGP